MELKQIQYFLAVAESGSFSAAAETLFISQSSVSKQISALETELNVRLFDRSRRKIELTEAGKVFYDYAVNFDSTHTALLADLSEFKITRPALSIAAIPVIAQYGIARYIAQFRSQYPKIALTLEEKEASTIFPALRNHEYTLAFVRDNFLDTSQFSSLECLQDKLLVVVSSQHRLASRKSLSLAELSEENFITFNRGTIVHEITMSACRQAGFEPRVFYATLRGASIIGLVASNSGVALMMEKVLKYYGRSDVVPIPLETPVESNIVVAYPKNRKLSRAAKTFLGFMKSVTAST